MIKMSIETIFGSTIKRSKLYGKYDNFFPIVNFPVISRNMPAARSYGENVP